jgi:hypothetical protein
MTDYMTTAEVAELLGYSIATINRRASTGLLPYMHKAPGLRGGYLFDRRIVEMYARTLKASA